MEKFIIIELDSYQILNTELNKGFELSELKNEFNNFWQKWTKIHLQLLQDLNQINHLSVGGADELKTVNEKFLRKRMGIISAFMQRIKKCPHTKNEIELLKNILYEHDEKFTAILNKILNTLLSELNKLKTFRKATNAYLYSQFSLGG